MSEHWVCLDLFSGLGGFSQDFEESPDCAGEDYQTTGGWLGAL